MPSFTATVLATLLAAGNLAAAHMEMSYPPPFRSKFNPNAGSNIDYSMTAPLSGDGSNYPCKGYHKDLGTAAGAPTASFAPGSTYNMTIVGGAAHGGGSCQASLSYDGGATFTVIESIIGGCPLNSNYDFTVPADAPTGQAIFAWTWQNTIGNREFYMNCAAVTVGGGSAKRDAIVKPRASFSSRPGIFLANLGNGCTTVEMSSVKYPDPGPDVKDNGGAQAPPSGSCGASAPAAPPAAPPAGPPAAPGGGSGGAPGGGSPAPAPTTPPAVSKPPTAPSKPTVIPAPGGGAKPSGPPGSHSSSSGVFITVPDAQPAAPTGTAPTTMVTATRPAAAPAGPTAPAAAPAPVAPVTGGQTGACTNEGAWNCVDGKSFQRCASGRWSAVIQMAAGTSCTPGVSEVLGMAGRRRRSVRRSIRNSGEKAQCRSSLVARSGASWHVSIC
ncbi:hypothetical protein QBC39DRAFT_392677 [Podospora conica]|nr:hypothetical protein QBC39DRAFT_392677 [Schizothecium conicum]